MLLADLGADVVRVDRPGGPGTRSAAPDTDLLNRGRRSRRAGPQAPGRRPRPCCALVERADVLVEGCRPGVAERLGIGPEACLARNPRAGLRPDDRVGPGRAAGRAGRARHRLHRGRRGAARRSAGPAAPPQIPLNLSATSAAARMLPGRRRAGRAARGPRTGRGQVVDAAIVDGAAHLITAFCRPARRPALGRTQRGSNLLDGGAPFYDVYATADGGTWPSARSSRSSTPSCCGCSGSPTRTCPPSTTRPAGRSCARRFADGLRRPHPRRVDRGLRGHRRLRGAGPVAGRGAAAPAPGARGTFDGASSVSGSPRRRPGSHRPPAEVAGPPPHAGRPHRIGAQRVGAGARYRPDGWTPPPSRQSPGGS